MSSGFVKYWAVGATAIALVLLGILIGQRLGQTPEPEALIDEGRGTELTEAADVYSNIDRTTGSGGESLRLFKRFSARAGCSVNV